MADPFAALNAKIEAAHDEGRALTLSILEKLMEKQMPGAYPIPFFSKKDGESVLARAQAIQDQFKNERAARASSLVLPPGAR